MDDRDRLIESLRNEIAKCDEFLARAGEASDLASAVQMRKEEAEARLKAVQRLPMDVFEEVGPEMSTRQKREAERLDDALPALPKMDVRFIRAQLSSAGTSTDSDMIASIVRIDPSQTAWYPEFIEPFTRLADDRNRENRIRAAFAALNPVLGGYVDKAISTTRSALGGVASVDLASQHLRDAIQKIWGEICDKARHDTPTIGARRLELSREAHRHEVAACLATSSASEEQLVELLASLTALHSDLSGAAKNPFHDDLQYLIEVSTRWKLHLYNLAQALEL